MTDTPNKKTKNVKKAVDLVLETHEEFIRIRSGVERLMLPLVQQYGLTPTQIAVLNLIKKNGKATVSTLFKTLDFNQGNMSSMCKKLQADGFVEKAKCEEDERKCYLTLTKKAEDALNGIDEYFNICEEDCWLSPEEFEAAVKAVEILRNAATIINQKLSETLSDNRG